MEINILLDDTVEAGYEEKFFQAITSETILTSNLDLKIDWIEISIVITTNDKIQEFNKLYRKIDTPTDVLSFPINESGNIESGMLGDIVISIDKVKEYANDAGINQDREMAFLYIHGLLHLLGYDHETSEADEEIMFDLQENILSKCIDKDICK